MIKIKKGNDMNPTSIYLSWIDRQINVGGAWDG